MDYAHTEILEESRGIVIVGAPRHETTVPLKIIITTALESDWLQQCIAQEYEDWLDEQEERMRVNDLWMGEFYRMLNIDPAERKALYKLDFTRPRIQDQVMERKPRHLVKKVIH